MLLTVGICAHDSTLSTIAKILKLVMDLLHALFIPSPKVYNMVTLWIVTETGTTI